MCWPPPRGESPQNGFGFLTDETGKVWATGTNSDQPTGGAVPRCRLFLAAHLRRADYRKIQIGM